MPDVSEIIERLRKNAWTVPGLERQYMGDVDGKPVYYDPVPRFDAVRLADAEAAVLAAVDARTAEIVTLLRETRADHHYPTPTDDLENARVVGYLDGADAAAGLIARRFPNGGTHRWRVT